jgi:hypothetical protein
VHLRQADLFGDFRLGQTLDESQSQDCPLALPNAAECAREGEAILNRLSEISALPANDGSSRIDRRRVRDV